MSEVMFALEKSLPQPGLWGTQAPVPEVGPDEVLIKVGHTAICGTDLHIWNWDEWAAATVPTPMIVGHEFSGEIVEIGKGVSRPLRIGARVSGEGHIVNLHSAASRAGRFHLDPDTVGIGVNRQGAFAEYVVLPAFNVVPLPDDVTDELGAILDPFGNAMHTAQQFELLGEDVLITGAGPIGIMAAAIARSAGARTVVITDQNDYRLNLAAALANVRPVNVLREDLRDVMAQEGIEDGFGVALEMSGATAAIEQAVDTLKMGGNLAMLGIPGKSMEVVWSRIILKALTIKGVYGREMFTTWRKMFGLIRGGLDLTPLITHRFDAPAFERGFNQALSGESGKVILKW
jgi:threonine 3-dehydrogenase